MPLRLLKTDPTPNLQFVDVFDESLINNDVDPPRDGRTYYRYAILSHRWKDGEVVYADCADPSVARAKAGWQKLDDFRTLARKHGYKYVWMDTCCIDKSSSTELAEALNSMFRWYQMAHVCWAYLYDVEEVWDTTETPPPSMLSVPTDKAEVSRLRQRQDEMRRSKESAGTNAYQFNTKARMDAAKDHDDMVLFPTRVGTYRPLLSSEQKWDSLVSSVWFSRGWTLQEMVASSRLIFFNKGWRKIRDLRHIASLVAHFTGVDKALLLGKRRLDEYSIAQKLSWAARRKTERIEDRAYSLFGILNVRIPIFYGEGNYAFYRLQEQLLASTSDTTIFAWHMRDSSEVIRKQARLLAESIDAFEHSGKISATSTAGMNQRIQTLGSQVVHLDAYAYHSRHDSWFNSRSDDSKVRIVIGCVDGAPHKLVTVELIRPRGAGDPYAVEWTYERRLQPCDLYAAQRMDQTTSLDVWRSREAAQSRGVKDQYQKIFIRYKSAREITSYASITKASPEAFWNRDQWAFTWRENVDFGDFEGHVELNNGLSLLIYKKPGTQVEVAFQSALPNIVRRKLQDWTGANISSIVEPAGASAIRNLGKFYLTAKVEQRMMLRDRVHFVDLEHLDASQIAVRNCMSTLDRIHLFSTAIVAAIPALLPSLPLLMVMGLRWRQSSVYLSELWGYRSTGSATAQNEGLYLAILLCLFPVTIWALVEKLNRVVTPGDRVLAGVKHMVRFYLVPRQLYYWIADFVSMVLCARCLVWALANTRILQAVGGSMFEDPGIRLDLQYQLLWPIGFRLATSIVGTIYPMATCISLFFGTLRLTLDFPRICLALVSAVPLGMALVATSTSTMPYAGRDCDSGNVTAAALQFYTQYSNITGWDVSSTCNYFAYEGSLAWAIFGLLIGEGAIATAAWLMLRSQHPAAAEPSRRLIRAMFFPLRHPLRTLRFVRKKVFKGVRQESPEIALQPME